MEWVEVVLFLLFIVLPLLQGLLGRDKKGGDPKPSHPEEPEFTELASEPPTELSAWDELFGAGATPAAASEPEEIEPEQAPVGLDTAPVEIVSLEPVEELREVPVAEAVFAADASPPLDQVRIDRRAEHIRFHTRVDAPSAPEPTRRSLGRDLHDPDQLRRAVILAEVLGPPRSLQ